MFSVGALSYLVAPLWLIFIALGLAGGGPAAGDAPLWLLTLAMLLLPRALGVCGDRARGEAAAFGGVLRLTGGALLELLLSSLQAPLRMLAHCIYVLGALTGLRLEWKSPPRGDERPRLGRRVAARRRAGAAAAGRRLWRGAPRSRHGAGADAAAADVGGAVHGAHRAPARGARRGAARPAAHARRVAAAAAAGACRRARQLHRPGAHPRARAACSTPRARRATTACAICRPA